MGISKKNRNFTSVQALVAEMVNTLVDAGAFELVAVNGSTSSLSVDATVQKVLLRATTEIDPLAVAETDTTHENFAIRQPWNLYIECNDANSEEDPLDGDVGFIDVYTLTPTNFTMDGGEVNIATSHWSSQGKEISKSGLMTIQSRTKSSTLGNVQPLGPNIEGTRFMAQNDLCHTWRYEYWDFDTSRMDVNAIPMSYQLTTSDHGVAFAIWAESFDKEGDKCFWVAIQRMVDKTGAPVITGKAPLFALFSPNGGGGEDVNEPDLYGIQHMVVRESDVNAPTFPTSSVVDQADSTRIINSVQQVSKGEDRKFTLNFARGLNTHRYSYPHELDMFLTTSADSVSQHTDVEVTAYDEETPRIYRSMNANFDNNTGMRLLLLVDGPTTTPEAE